MAPIKGNTVTTVPSTVAPRARPEVEHSIARWAAGLVQDGDTIAMDASPVVLAMAHFLVRRRNLVVLTTGIEIGQALSRIPTNRVLLLGNLLRADGAAVVGHLHEPALRSLKSATAFVSCDGFSLAAGLTDRDADEALVKSQVVGLAQATVALIESAKYGRVCQAPFARADQLAHILTDDGLEPHWVEQVQDASIALTLCHPLDKVKA
jgi:DeoR family transcriptional regulator, aga operon transcriptional repressor